MSQWPLGICTHIWGKQPLDRVLDEVAAAGYAGVELFDHQVADFYANPEAFRQLLAARGLALASLYYEGDFLRPGDREQEVGRARQAAAFCAALECHQLVVGPGHRPGDATPDYDCLAATLEAIGRSTAALGVASCFHPHAGSTVETGEEIDRVFGQTDPRWVPFCIDTGHIHRGGSDVVAVTRRYRERIRHVHLKDVHPSGKFTELGRGFLDNGKVLEVLRETGYAGWVLTEVPISDVTEPTPAASAARHLEWLRPRV